MFNLKYSVEGKDYMVFWMGDNLKSVDFSEVFGRGLAVVGVIPVEVLNGALNNLLNVISGNLLNNFNLFEKKMFSDDRLRVRVFRDIDLPQGQGRDVEVVKEIISGDDNTVGLIDMVSPFSHPKVITELFFNGMLLHNFFKLLNSADDGKKGDYIDFLHAGGMIDSDDVEDLKSGEEGLDVYYLLQLKNIFINAVANIISFEVIGKLVDDAKFVKDVGLTHPEKDRLNLVLRVEHADSLAQVNFIWYTLFRAYAIIKSYEDGILAKRESVTVN